MAVLEIAAAHQRRRQTLARRAATAMARLWGTVDPDAIASSWTRAMPTALTVLETAQTTAAAAAGPYLDELTDEYGLEGAAAGAVAVTGFAGMASDGRDLAGLLYRPVISALRTIKRGATPRQGLSAGRFALDLIVRTQIADAGRAADGVALVARPQLGGWVRMLSLPSCPRCVILAGRYYRWDDGFLRHERCDCTHIPANEDVAGDLRTDPKAYFDSLSEAEQDEIFGPSSAQAIRDGADMNRVVNAARSTYTAGGKRYTRDATTRRGAGRRVRLTVDQIYAEAGGNRDEALRLLRLHGYLLR